MSHEVLRCPRCLAPAPPRVDMVPFGYVDRFHCDACGLTTLREELVRDRRLDILRGGSAGLPGLPVTLRPAGDLGDQNDTTYSQLGAADGTLTFAWTDFADQTFSGTISKIEFYVRASATFDGQGPSDPPFTLDFRQGATGTTRTAGNSTLVGDDPATTFGPYSVTQDQDSAAWTNTTVNSLQVRLEATAEDNNSQLSTTVRAYEYWAVVS